MDIEKFKSSFSDIMRPNKFKVEFQTPFNLGLDNSEMQQITYLCKSASFPFGTIEKSESYYNGLKHGLASGIDFDPVSLVLYSDTDQKVMTFLSNWYKKISPNKKGSNTGMKSHGLFEYPSNYYGTIHISLIHKDNSGASIDGFKILKSVKLIDAYPTNIDSIPLSYDSNDQVMEMTVSFEFNNLEYSL